jgi:hypothetical protein
MVILPLHIRPQPAWVWAAYKYWAPGPIATACWHLFACLLLSLLPELAYFLSSATGHSGSPLTPQWYCWFHIFTFWDFKLDGDQHTQCLHSCILCICRVVLGITMTKLEQWFKYINNTWAVWMYVFVLYVSAHFVCISVYQYRMSTGKKHDQNNQQMS